MTCPGRRPPPASFILEAGGFPKHLLRCNCLTEYIVMAINGFKSKQLSAARAHKLLKVRRTRVFPLCKGNTTLSLHLGRCVGSEWGLKRNGLWRSPPALQSCWANPLQACLAFLWHSQQVVEGHATFFSSCRNAYFYGWKKVLCPLSWLSKCGVHLLLTLILVWNLFLVA